jgi:hypothetical protein
MTDESKTRKAEKHAENLDLTRETIQELSEQDAHAVRGGVAPVLGPDWKKKGGEEPKKE